MNSENYSIKQSEFDETLVNDINIYSLPSCLGNTDSSCQSSSENSCISYLANHLQKKIRKERKKKVKLKCYKARNLFKKSLKPFFESKYVTFLD